MPDGKDYATIQQNAKAILLYKGEDDAFVAEWNRMEGGADGRKSWNDDKVEWNVYWKFNSKILGTTVELAFTNL